jgi:hypothetical protein
MFDIIISGGNPYHRHNTTLLDKEIINYLTILFTGNEQFVEHVLINNILQKSNPFLDRKTLLIKDEFQKLLKEHTTNKTISKLNLDIEESAKDDKIIREYKGRLLIKGEDVIRKEFKNFNEKISSINEDLKNLILSGEVYRILNGINLDINKINIQNRNSEFIKIPKLYEDIQKIVSNNNLKIDEKTAPKIHNYIIHTDNLIKNMIVLEHINNKLYNLLELLIKYIIPNLNTKNIQLIFKL